jgi:CPA2 family monovalent cation:H+ antiporter-2
VLQPARVGHAVLGAALVALAAAALVAGGRVLARHNSVAAVRRRSTQRHWALDLRIALLALFFLAWLAQRSGTSVLIAGFGAGVTAALVGGPKRLSTQIRGVADGFFVPLYFVVLGAQLDLGGLFEHPQMIALAGALAGLNVLIHLAASRAGRVSAGAALAASAQLGVPAAVASLGLAEGVLSSEIATAIVAASIVSLVVCTVGVQRLLARAPVATPTLAR